LDGAIGFAGYSCAISGRPIKLIAKDNRNAALAAIATLLFSHLLANEGFRDRRFRLVQSGRGTRARGKGVLLLTRP
jgi:hypothetical protein